MAAGDDHRVGRPRGGRAQDRADIVGVGDLVEEQDQPRRGRQFAQRRGGQRLDLGGNALGARGLEALLRAGFPGKATPNLTLLDVRNNALQDEGARTLVRFLAAQPSKASPVPKLQVLELTENQITKDVNEGGAEPLVRQSFAGKTIFV